MAMSRSLGGTPLTTRSPMRISPDGDVLEAGDHAQQRRFSATRRTDEDDELAIAMSTETPCRISVVPNALRTSRHVTLDMASSRLSSATLSFRHRIGRVAAGS